MIIESAALISIGKRLTELVAKPAAEAIFVKIKGLKEEKDVNKLRSSYEEIITNLLEERTEAITIAKAYREKVESIEISEEDITSLHNTLSASLDLLSQVSTLDDSEIESMQTLKNLVSADTLKALQLMGFNYKEAVGETLTKITKSWIEVMWSPKLESKTQN